MGITSSNLPTFKIEKESSLMVHGWFRVTTLQLANWSPFYASKATMESTMAWIRFPNIFMMFHDEDVLTAIAFTIRKLVKIDINTRLANRGRFARVCVEINLTKPLMAKFWLNGHWHTVEYEGLHIICYGCGKYGHRINQCPFANPPEPANVSNTNTVMNR